jgi:ABC-type glycerol-3-phosphate transport system permease component
MPPRRIEEIKHGAKWHIQVVLIIAVIVTLLPIVWVLLTQRCDFDFLMIKLWDV